MTRPSEIKKQKRLALELISNNLNVFHDLETRVSLVNYSVRDLTKGKTYVETKGGVKTKNMRGLKNTESLDLLIKYLEIVNNL